MHFDAFDRYHESTSFIHRLDPRVKVSMTIAFILSNALLPDGAWIAFTCSWIFLILVNVLSELGVLFSFKRSFIALPFALIAITVLFSVPGNSLASFHFLFWDLTVTDMGLLRFVSIVIRSWLSVQMAIMLVGTTRFPDIVHALEHLHVPSILTTIIAFLYRYLFVLADEVSRLLRQENPVRHRRQVQGPVGAWPGVHESLAIWRVSFFYGVMNAVTVSTMRCFHEGIQVICKR